MQMHNKISETLASGFDPSSPVLLSPCRGATWSNQNANHFLLLLKPELTNSGSETDVDGVGFLIHQVCAEFGAYVAGISLLPSQFVYSHRLIERNYPTLHDIAQRGLDACSPSIITQVRQKFPMVESSSNVYGGFQFLSAYPEFSAQALCELNDRTGAIKLGANAYGAAISYLGRNMILLNGFYPFQFSWLSREGSHLIAMECFTDRPWSDIRAALVGDIRPAQADAGSLRNELYLNRSRLGLKDLGLALNGIHVSPGPVEAIFQLAAFFDGNNGLRADNTLLGSHIASLFGSPMLTYLEQNPLVVCGAGERFLFEATENINAADAVNLLCERYHVVRDN